MFTHAKLTLQILKSLLPGDPPKYFMLFTLVFSLPLQTWALNIVFSSSLKYLRAIHAVVAGGEKVFMRCINRPEFVTSHYKLWFTPFRFTNCFCFGAEHSNS